MGRGEGGEREGKGGELEGKGGEEGEGKGGVDEEVEIDLDR